MDAEQRAHSRRRRRRRRCASALLDEFELEIGGGLGPMKGKVWRIGLMGESSSEANVLLVLSALERVLPRCGYRARGRRRRRRGGAAPRLEGATRCGRAAALPGGAAWERGRLGRISSASHPRGRPERPLERGARPLRQIGGGHVGALQEREQRLIRRRAGAHGVVGQHELAERRRERRGGRRDHAPTRIRPAPGTRTSRRRDTSTAPPPGQKPRC